MAASTTTIQGQQGQAHWRDRFVQNAAVLSDIWNVMIAWGAGGAVIVLGLCLVANIIELFWAPPLFANGVLVIQSITLDVAGLGLGSMARTAKRLGHDEAAKHARAMNIWLLSLMVVTVALISMKLIPIFKPIDQYITWTETGLILIRVVTTVFYFEVMQAIKDAMPTHATSANQVATVTAPAGPDLLKSLEELKTELLNQMASQVATIKTDVTTDLNQALHPMDELKSQILVLTQQLASNQADLNQALQTIQELKNQPAPAPHHLSESQVPARKPTPLHRPGKQQDTETIGKPLTKKDFVLDCLNDDPEMPTAEIKAAGQLKKLDISDAIISQCRKEFKSQQLNLRLVNE